MIDDLSTQRTIVGERNSWLDCLRGYAVIIVCVSHFFYLPPIKAALPFATTYFKGDIGVWLFYVLSGYLIGGLLLREKEKHGEVRLLRFYGRRFSRLLPSYLMFIAILWLVGQPVLEQSGVPWWAFFIPWLDMTAGTGYLPYHLRTLHIEEKFYMIWGLLSKYLGRPMILALAIGLVIYGPIARILVFLPDGPRTLMFDGAADCFGIGILSAYFGYERLIRNKVVSHVLAWPVFRPAVLLTLMLVFGAVRTIKPFSYPLVPFLPTVIALLSVCLLASGWFRKSALQLCWMAEIGLASYTIYLFQQLVLCPWNDVYEWDFNWWVWGGAVMTTALFVCVWFLKVEAPVLMWGKRKFKA